MPNKFVQTLINLCGFLIAKLKNNKAKVMLLSGSALILFRLLFPGKQSAELVSISNFLKTLQQGKVQAAVVRPNYIIFRDSMKKIRKANHCLMPRQTLYNLLKNAKIDFSYSNSTVFLQMLIFFLLSVVITLAYFYFTKQDDSIKKKPIKQIMFSDIAGMNQSKQALRQVIQYMKNPLKFSNIGARMRKGIILYGPPGTGKTTVAKACAAEAGVQFFACNASEFCQIYIGAGPKKVRQLFRRAKQCAPSIVFIDQIDAIGNRKNKSIYDSGADTERNSTINQLLSEMDGFGSHDSVLVIAATNRLQLIDKSLLRPGRFDLKIPIALPRLEQRKDIFYLHLKSKKHNLSQEFVTSLAERMVAWSGADIQNLANQSVYQALRRGSQMIEQEDVKNCMQNVAISGRH